MKNCFDPQKIPDRFPAQHQDYQPGIEARMNPLPVFDDPCYTGSGKLEGKAALITGGDSGIGRAVAVAFAKEGAAVAIAYLNEQEDAEYTRQYIRKLGGRCILLQGDIRHEHICRQIVNAAARALGKIDILVNNAGVQFPQQSIRDISKEQLYTTYEVNVFSMFYFVKAVLNDMPEGGSIINTTSVTAYQGEIDLIDYSSTKGAIVSFTRALSQSLVSQKIRVNAVAPGPIWTPLIVASFSAEKVTRFGTDVPMKRAGQPCELAPAYVYLASEDSSYVTGQVIHVNGGTIVES
ncbi:MAG TPA: SDR family oxidoreductase [Candidatus Eisenbergiella merdipullorum]|uniref:SDR family oxidoreductase n=1 Tax=Candidatus Eisenbergiella merdipullorum TaxID=2838553 RepID=A0A9D2I7G6_9FIRM|nr:SDR family oxidoreductase [Candidatus Eisenbergiella merdipullorum]